MKTLLIVLAAVMVLTLCVTATTTGQLASHVVISEIYGGGGNAGSTFRNDYLELYNPTASPVAMTNWSIQYATAAGVFSNGASKKTIFSGTIPAFGFFLIKEAQGSGGTTDLPAPDAAGLVGLSASDGKVALASDTVTVSGPDGAHIVDFVGYGSANQFEGSGPAGGLSNTASAERKAQWISTSTSMLAGGTDGASGNGWDSDNNNADFVIQSTQTPQNSTSTPEPPPVIRNAPPLISAMSRSPFVPNAGATDTVIATIVDNDGVVVGGRLHVKVNGGTEDSTIVMTPIGGDVYRGVLPASKNSAGSNLVEYYISAFDDSSNYASTRQTLQGYFVGDTRIDSVKGHPLSSIIAYGVRINGTLNVRTNTFVNGQGFIQNASGGLEMFVAGGLPDLLPGRNVKVQASIVDFQGAYELGMPGFALVDTSLGTSVLAAAVVALPIAESPSQMLEGKLVSIHSMGTSSTGTFAASTNYLFHESDSDTITVRVESNGTLNSLVGRTIPNTPTDVVGILSFSGNYLRLKPRGSADMGLDPADGSGTALIAPSFRFQSQPVVSETLMVIGDGASTIRGISVEIPSTWTWADTNFKLLAGAGFTGASAQVSGDGSTGNPYLITISGSAVTNTSTGKLMVSHLSTPSSAGSSLFLVRTRGATGSLAAIASSPAVAIGSAFEAVTSGNWSNPLTWSGGAVPDSLDDVSLNTLGVIVALDVPNARCRNLALVGGGSASNSGPVLRFEATGNRQLTVYGNLSLSTTSGGLGGGGGDRGGRPQLTSNGNPLATLVIRHTIITAVGNSSANGNSGLNMNEGTVSLSGPTVDSLRNSSSLRLGNLIVGNGSSAKTLVWAPSTSSTLFIRSLRVKSGSVFFIGSASNANANSIGNPGSEPTAAYLSGGITVEAGARLTVQSSNSGQSSADINLDGGGIIVEGLIQLISDSSGSGAGASEVVTRNVYNLRIGGFTGGSPSTHQIIGGTHIGHYGSIIIDGGDTLELRREVDIDPSEKVTVAGRLLENSGAVVVGTVEATRSVNHSVQQDFGGIGVVLNAAGIAPGVTRVTRYTGSAATGGGNHAIRRSFDISPTIDTSLNAVLDFYYDDSELNGQQAVSLALWKSDDHGNSWTSEGGTIDTLLHRLRITGVNELSRWTASDTAHPLSSAAMRCAVNARWNMVSVPLKVSNDSSKVVFPGSVSPAYTYESGYVQEELLERGKGYWLKFPAAESVTVRGNILPLDTISLKPGWNMIGSISDSVPMGTIGRIPPTMRLSQLYGYAGGYHSSETILPAHGYWLKANAPGNIVLGSVFPAAKRVPVNTVPPSCNALTVRDSEGNSQTLYFSGGPPAGGSSDSYELPPRPPQGIFDVRFASQRYLEYFTSDSVSGAERSIILQAVHYPLTILWHMIDKERTFVLSEPGKEKLLGPQVLEGDGKILVTNRNANEILLVMREAASEPKAFALGRNFPNPFNPTTSLVVSAPTSALVRLVVYDILGRRVKTLFDAELSAGYRTIHWDGTTENGSRAGSGVYFVRMTSGRFAATRRLMMMK